MARPPEGRGGSDGGRGQSVTTSQSLFLVVALIITAVAAVQLGASANLSALMAVPSFIVALRVAGVIPEVRRSGREGRPGRGRSPAEEERSPTTFSREESPDSLSPRLIGAVGGFVGGAVAGAIVGLSYYTKVATAHGLDIDSVPSPTQAVAEIVVFFSLAGMLVGSVSPVLIPLFRRFATATPRARIILSDISATVLAVLVGVPMGALGGVIFGDWRVAP